MRRGFTLLELLVVIAIIAILAAILFPLYSRAKEQAKKTNCLSNQHQIGVGFAAYLMDSDDKMPDRRDLKQVGYRPWTSWPPSDPRVGWAPEILSLYTGSSIDLWRCPSILGTPTGRSAAVVGQSPLGETNYWMWRFDRFETPVPLDNFWGKSPEEALSDLLKANNPTVGKPNGIADVELLVDPYFPKTAPGVNPQESGYTPHTGGRNRLYLDTHAKWFRDVRTD
jgi:prepilin-type N-terminal cleavage/methylation domain-containing protein